MEHIYVSKNKGVVLRIGSYHSKQFGSVDVNLHHIGALFDVYKREYSEIFKLNSIEIESLKRFKMKSGGELISLNSADKTLAIMSFRNIVDKDCKELGDVMKLVSRFSRSDFAKGLSIASTFIAAKGSCIISYFGRYSFPMIMQAGYKILNTYDKVNYLALMGFGVLIPLVRDGKLQIKFKKVKAAPLVLFGLALRKTRLRIKGMRVYALSNSEFKVGNIFDFGVLYRYIINDNDNGSPIICYGDCNPEKITLGYEYSDNSA